ncbi:hypothetical protein [Chryseolinea lacunae]|uniref:Outer membrane lipoprotein carrier protein LolA n=1 Tax=Chryseolinea lacunae TaxID=2801331 RepID=A0ABS1L2L3_9BACT|nr:hypothetical protein [Chryseolinea lacunae]MBL0745931.1 hypothetical protein [Chryseolinea lacunae]
MRIIIPLLVLLCDASISLAQIDSLQEIIGAAFYEERISEKIFFDYRIKKKIKTRYVLPERRYAFITPTLAFRKRYPDVVDKLGVSWWTENKWFSIDFIKNKKGDILITNDIFDSDIELMVAFDSIVVQKQLVNLVFHTTSYGRRKNMSNRYVKIECSLKRRGRTYRVKDLKITPIDCCFGIWDPENAPKN